MRRLLGILTIFAAVSVVAFGYYTRYRPDPARYPVQGIDVSHHQNTIRWGEVAADGIAFAYIKATEGGSYKDERFDDNWKASRAAGLVRGAYHFYSFCRGADAQAKNFIANVPKEAGALPPVLDLEFGGNCDRRPPTDEVRQSLETMAALLEAAYGSRPVLYVTREFLAAYVSALPRHAGLWLRSIAWAPRFSDTWAFWQYHNRGSVKGIDGPVDRNVYNGSAADFASYARLSSEKSALNR